MSKQIKPADLQRASDNGIDATLYCTKCHGTYSAHPGDYWHAPADHVFKCCRRNNLLVAKRTVIEEVQ